jgi:hypothetical protein
MDGSRMDRRTVLAGGVKLTAGGVLAALMAERGLATAWAQEATPPAGLDLSAYPELAITVTDQEATVSTETIPAGFVVLTVTNAQTSESAESTGAGLIGPPAGMSMDDFLAEVGTQLSGTPAADGTPTSIDGFPLLAFQAVIPGGPGNIDPGQTARAIVQVPAGTWAVITEGDQAPVVITATEGTPAAAPAPTVSATVTETEFAFGGLDGGVPAGPQVWSVENQGTEPHMLVVLGVPAGMTKDQFMTMMSMPENATPPAGVNPADFRDSGGIFLQSGGTTVWPVLDLEPGHYLALCFVPDPRNGMPHVMEGMIAAFDAA